MYKRRRLKSSVARAACTSSQRSNVISTASSDSINATNIEDIEQVLSANIPERYNSTLATGDKNIVSSSVSFGLSPIKKSSLTPIKSQIAFAKKNTYMEQVVLSCGMVLNSEQSVELKCDQALFVRDLTAALHSKPELLLKNAEQFMKDFQDYHSDKDLLIKSLSPCMTANDCNVVRGTVQDCFVRLLLQVDSLQPKLIEYLLDKLGEYALENVEIDAEPDSITWVRMILQPLRFINCIVDSKNLCERLFDVIWTTSDNMIQQEIITCLPDIISDNEHYYAAAELSKLVRSSANLLPSILDSLNNLSLQSDIISDVQQSMIVTLHRARVDFLPNIVRFLLSTSNSQSYNEVINGLRSELFSLRNSSTQQTQMVNNISQLSCTQLDNKYQLVFGNVRDCLLSCKQLADAWLRNISEIKTHLNSKPIDMLILLILHNIANDASKKRSVETVIRNHIKNEIFRINLIQDMLKKFLVVVKEYYSSLLTILSKLLKSPDVVVSEFSSATYICCFENVTGFWCKNLVMELLAYIGAGDVSNAQLAFSTLSEISSKYPEKVKPLAPILGVLLNKLTDLSLAEVQQLMDMLCCIAFSNNSSDEVDTTLLQDELNILIQKQLASSRISILRNGVVGGVMAIKHIASVPPSEPNEWPDKSSSDECLISLTVRANRAYNILGMIIKGTESNPEAQGLFFDQFSLMLMKCKDLDRTFLYHLSTVMKQNLKLYFLIASDEFKPTDFLDCIPQFGLNNDAESIILNLTPTLIEEIGTDQTAGTRTYTIVLHSLFRLLRGLEYEDLSEIDALLDCPIAMPTFSTVVQEFSILSPEQQTVTMDSLFHLVNWFRECVNCFSYMVKQGDGDKVLMRLRAIIWIQNWISRCLPQLLIPNYCPPKCHFHTTTKAPSLPTDKKRKNGPKSKKKKTDADKSVDASTSVNKSVSQAALMDVDTNGELKEIEANLKLYKPFFRDLDIDVWILLTVPLVLNPQPEKNCEFSPELGPAELLFILEDYVQKLQLALTSDVKRRNFKNSTNTDVAASSSSLYIAVPGLIAKNSVKLLPSLCSHLETINQFCQNLLESNDNVYDSTGMFMPESRVIKLSGSLIFKSMTILLSWRCFQTTAQQELLIVALQRIISRTSAKSQFSSLRLLVKECVKYFIGFKDSALYLDAAVNLVSLLDTLNTYSEDSHIQKSISDLCWDFLTRRWYDLIGCEEKGVTYNRHIESLLSSFFNNSPDKFRAIENMNEWMKEEVNYLTSKDSVLKTLPTISRSNFNIIIRVICKTLESAAKEEIGHKIPDKDKLDIWLSVMCSMESLVIIIKIQDLRPNLISFIKGSVPILKLFLSQGITVCSLLFRVESTLVSHTLKKLQVSTRYIQNICNYTKVTEDSTLGSYLPMIRSLLESILLKVKNIIVLNGCTEAFFMGSMRNKDIKGKEINSQSSVDEDSNNFENAEVECDENVDQEVELNCNDEDGDEISANEDESETDEERE